MFFIFACFLNFSLSIFLRPPWHPATAPTLKNTGLGQCYRLLQCCIIICRRAYNVGYSCSVSVTLKLMRFFTLFFPTTFSSLQSFTACLLLFCLFFSSLKVNGIMQHVLYDANLVCLLVCTFDTNRSPDEMTSSVFVYRKHFSSDRMNIFLNSSSQSLVWDQPGINTQTHKRQLK